MICEQDALWVKNTCLPEGHLFFEDLGLIKVANDE
jgi:hypothetical protein